MVDISPDALRAALRAIKDPASGRDIVTAGLVEGIEVRGGLVQATLLTDRAHAAAMEPVRREAEAVLMRQPGVTNATAILTAHKPPAAPGPAAGPARGRQVRARVGRPAGAGTARAVIRRRPGARREAGAAAAGREGDRCGCLRQGRRRQIHGGGQSRGFAGPAGAQGRACWMRTSMGRACRG